jgi:hypothetical protein
MLMCACVVLLYVLACMHVSLCALQCVPRVKKKIEALFFQLCMRGWCMCIMCVLACDSVCCC